jgi:RNA polymerase sigma factor (sigma-70 family)
MTEILAIQNMQDGTDVETGFNFLYAHYHTSIRNLCFRFLRNRDEAEDATQEVFLHLYQKIKFFRGDALFSTWLFSVAKNRCISLLRASHARIPRGCDVCPAGCSDTDPYVQENITSKIPQNDISQIDRMIYNEAFQAMPAETQENFMANVLYGHSAEMVCRERGIESTPHNRTKVLRDRRRGFAVLREVAADAGRTIQ